MITAGASRVASGLLCVHAIAITPAGPMELVRSSISTISGLPCVTVRSAPAITFSGPAQRSITLWPARSPSRLATLYIESSDSFVASAAASIATGWSEPVPGRELHPLKSSALSRRTVTTVINSLGFQRPNLAGYIVAIALLSTRLSYEDNRANVPEKKRVRREPHPDWNLRCRQLIVWAAVYFLFISSSVQSSFLKFDHQ